MKRFTALFAILTLAFAGVANAHGPSRHKVVETIDINASPDAVWNIVKDFDKVSWMPMVASVKGQGGNAEGATRELTLKNGGVIKEELKKHDADKKSLSYKITEVDPKVLPVATYTATITVEAGAAGGSKVEWSGAFYRSWMTNNPPPEQNDETAVAAVTGIYKEGLAHLKSLAEKK